MELKVADPKGCDKLLKHIRKGKCGKNDLQSKFPGKEVQHELDIMTKNGVLKRTIVRENGRNMIKLECTDSNVKFRQGRIRYPDMNKERF